MTEFLAFIGGVVVAIAVVVWFFKTLWDGPG